MTTEQFGPYRLEALLGRGGMGEVYRAFDTEHERLVAVKRLAPHLADDPDFRIRFKQEARLAARLRNPHIITIHRFGELGGRLFIDMRYVHGFDAADLVKAIGPLPPARAVALVEQIASALDTAHAAGLVHRDVKPSNLLIDSETPDPVGDFVYLADFGITRLTSTTRSYSLTRTGALLGSLDYMAPEQFDGVVDKRVDIYALACVFFELLTGTKPYHGAGLPRLMRAHLTEAPPRPSASRPELGTAFDSVVERGMAKDREQRFEAAGELAAAARAGLVEAGHTAEHDVGDKAAARSFRDAEYVYVARRKSWERSDTGARHQLDDDQHGDTEQGDTEQGDTEQGDTEQGQGDTEQPGLAPAAAASAATEPATTTGAGTEAGTEAAGAEGEATEHIPSADDATHQIAAADDATEQIAAADDTTVHSPARDDSPEHPAVDGDAARDALVDPTTVPGPGGSDPEQRRAAEPTTVVHGEPPPADRPAVAAPGSAEETQPIAGLVLPATSSDPPTVAAGRVPAPDSGAADRDSNRPGWYRPVGVAVGVVAVLALIIGLVSLGSDSGSDQQAAAPGVAAPPAAPDPAGPDPTGPDPTDSAPPVPVPASIGNPAVQATVPVGPAPQGVAVAPDSGAVYVANVGSNSLTVIRPARLGDPTVSVPLPGTPHYVTATPDGRQVWVGLYSGDGADSSIAVLDTGTNAVVANLAGARLPYALVAAGNGDVLVPNHGNATVSVFDGTSREMSTAIAVAPNPHGVTVTPSGDRAYTANHESNNVSVIDLPSRTAIATVPVGRAPHSIASSPDGRVLAAANYADATITLIDTATNQPTATVPAGPTPQHLTFAPDGRHIYVVNESAGTITTIDAQARTIASTTPVGASPRFVVAAPDGRVVYVTNSADNTISVLGAA